MPKTKFALVLSGGGFKGAFQVGALEYLKEHGVMLNGVHHRDVHFDIVAGVSVGSLNGALVASDQFEVLRKIWFEEIPREGKEVIFESTYIDDEGEPVVGNILKDLIPRLSFGRIIRLVLSKKYRKAFLAEALQNVNHLTALASNAPLRQKLNMLISRQSFQNACYLMGFVSLNNGKYYGVSHDQFPTDEDLRNAVLASTAMPIVWDPVAGINVEGEQEAILNAVDGGLRNVSPLGDVIRKISARAGEDEKYVIVIINTQGGDPAKWPADEQLSLTKIAARSLIEITLSEIFNNDIDLFTEINGLVRQAKAQGVQLYKEKNGKQVALRDFDCLIIQPVGAELGGTLDTTPGQLENRRYLGKLRAQEAMGIPMDPLAG